MKGIQKDHIIKTLFFILGTAFISFPTLTQAADHKIFLVGKLANYKGDIDYIAVFTASDVIRKYADESTDDIIYITNKEQAKNMPEPALERGVVALRKLFIESGLMSKNEADTHFAEILPNYIEIEKHQTSPGFHQEGNVVHINGRDYSLNCYQFNFCENNSCTTAHACH